MYIPHIKPIDGIDELLKVVSKSDLWTERIGQIKEYTEWINEHLDIAGTKEDAKKLESNARGLVREAEETKTQVDEYAARTRNDADAYAVKIRSQVEDSRQDAAHRMETVKEEEAAINKRLTETSNAQEQLAKDQVELENNQQRASRIRTEAMDLKQEYSEKLATLKQLAN